MARRWNELLMDDHQATEKVFAAMRKAFALAHGPSPALVAAMTDYFTTYLDRVHNMKEENHLFPLIEQRGVPRHGGPLAVMLAEHEQSRGLLARLSPLAESYIGGDRAVLPELKDTFEQYAGLLADHFWKENDILYPMALRVMSPEDEAAVVAGIEATEAAAGPGIRERFHGLADNLASAMNVEDLSFGLDRGVLAAMLNTLPVELSFVDADDTVRYFSHESSDKIFPRARSAIGTKVQNCHPQKSVHMVNAILADFKAGKRDVAEFWIDFRGMKVHIRYFAVRGAKSEYLGCLEVVQDIAPLQKIAGQKRLLDPA
jgi:DUF438 domain-containing protein